MRARICRMDKRDARKYRNAVLAFNRLPLRTRHTLAAIQYRNAVLAFNRLPLRTTAFAAVASASGARRSRDSGSACARDAAPAAAVATAPNAPNDSCFLNWAWSGVRRRRITAIACHLSSRPNGSGMETAESRTRLSKPVCASALPSPGSHGGAAQRTALQPDCIRRSR